MAKIYGQLEKAQLENTTSDTASLPKGMATYRTDLNISKVSNGTVMKEIIDEDSSQSLSNKTLASPAITGAQTLSQIATPANPAAGKNKLYFKADNNLYTLTSGGVETVVAGSTDTNTGVGSGGIVTKSANYTIVAGDVGKIILVDSSGGAFNLTLPTPVADFIVTVKDSKGSLNANNVTMVRAGSEKIDEVAASYILTADFGAWTFVSNGTDWFIL